MVSLPPEAGRQLAEALYMVLDQADRLLAFSERVPEPEQRRVLQEIGKRLFSVAKENTATITNDPRALAPAFGRILTLSDDLLRVAGDIEDSGTRGLLTDIARQLAEASRQFAPAIKSAAEKEGLAWAGRIKA
jgi:hypothetical protein